MNISCGSYEVRFENGGVYVFKEDRCLYYNARPLYVSIKDISAVCVFKDVPYAETKKLSESKVEASGHFVSENGSEFLITDTYEIVAGSKTKGNTAEENTTGETNDGLGTASANVFVNVLGLLTIHRKVEVLKKAERDLGFQTKIGLWMKDSDNMDDYNFFSPGEWYKHNEFANENAMGRRTDLSYYWRKETYSGLPMFSMQHIESGETVCFSRLNADVKLGSVDRVDSESYVDPKATIGALGVSKPNPEALLYTYYGAKLTKPIDAQTDGLSIDYIYPGTNGEMVMGWGNMNIKRVNHPVEVGFTHEYSIEVLFANYPSFQNMMKNTWRHVYPRLKDRLADISNEALFENNMKLFNKITNEYAPGVWGTPFAAQLPQFDPNSTSAEIGFVGQQTGIGYQLIRWGTLNGNAEAVKKGKGIVDFWVNKTMTETGCPKVWYQMGLDCFEPQPQFIRQLGDGLEGILDAYVFLHNEGEEKASWLDYLVKSADWLVKVQNEDGSFYRSYNYDGSMCMDSKANTPSIIRFLVEMYFVTKNEQYKETALKAGDWTYDNLYINMEYRGGTCDNQDILDKEAGIYALFAFLSLYDLNGDEKWVEASKGAADYVETYTYIWNFPVTTNFPTMPFNKNHISGQSHIVAGMGAADVYMACGGYVYYRLYLITGDEHYRDYAEFIYINSKQANDIDGSMGAAIPGLVHESGMFCEQLYQGNYHWLPWCTFVEVDPVSRMVDTFGVYEIADAEKLPMEKRQEMNRIYENWYRN